MRYLLLLYSDPEQWRTHSEATLREVVDEHRKLVAELQAAGRYRGGDALEWSDAATSLRIREGRTLVTDGPFAETREQLGGYYLVEVDGLDDAMAIAGRIPDARVGCVEIRPVKDVGQEPRS
jgi:hypothetical protein